MTLVSLFLMESLLYQLTEVGKKINTLIKEGSSNIFFALVFSGSISLPSRTLSQNLMLQNYTEDYCHSVSDSDFQQLLYDRMNSEVLQTHNENWLILKICLPDDNILTSDTVKLTRNWQTVFSLEHAKQMNKMLKRKKINTLDLYNMVESAEEISTCFLYFDRDVFDQDWINIIWYNREIYDENLILLANEIVRHGKWIIIKNSSVSRSKKNYIDAYLFQKEKSTYKVEEKKWRYLQRQFAKKMT